MTEIPYGRHWLEPEDIQEVVDVLRTDCITQGPWIERFESRVAQFCGARHAVAFSSGTAALHAACFAAGIGPGDEVITSPLTFVATANAVLYQGGTPVFADIDADSWNMDPDQVERKIGPRTRALLPVHFAGLPCAMGRIQALANQHGLTVIEDASHALGAEWGAAGQPRRRVGSCAVSDMTVFSFHPVKHITSGEGGMVLTNQANLADSLRRFRHHGIVRIPDARDQGPWHYEMRDLGFNYRITDFQCALGYRQMEKLERFLARREQIAHRYRQALGPLGLGSQDGGEENVRHAWHLYAVQLPLERLHLRRAEIFCALRDSGLGVQVHYWPVPMHPYYRDRLGTRPEDYPVAQRYYERTLTLPLYPKMSEEQVQVVLGVVQQLMGKALSSEPASKGGSACNPVQ